MPLSISLACGDYDRTRPLFDGRAAIDGCEVRRVALPLEEIFGRAFATGEFDVTELSFSNFMLRTANGDCPYVGIPAFPSRTFRHSALYIRTDRGIERPQDLRGKLVGVREYSNTAALVVRGLLEDEYGVRAHEMRWRIGDVDHRERESIPPPRLPAAYDAAVVTDGRLLSDLLADGTLDALLAYQPPRCFTDRHPSVARLFRDPVAAEQDYHARTRRFPIMHLVGIRRDLAARNPGLARRVHDAFCRAKAAAIADLGASQALKVTLPWAAAELERTKRAMGEDFWPYGVAANRAILEAMTGYPVSQGLIGRRLGLEELFEPSTLDT